MPLIRMEKNALDFAAPFGDLQVVNTLIGAGIKINISRYTIEGQEKLYIREQTQWYIIGTIFEFYEWRTQSSMLAATQIEENEGNIFHYLGVCLYGVSDLLVPWYGRQV